MTLSPSDIFNQAVAGNSVSIEKYLSVKPHHNTNRVRVIYALNQNKPTFTSKSLICANPLAMMQAISVLRTELHKLLGEEARAMLEQEQAFATAAYLEQQRKEIARKHRERIAEEQRRAENAVRHVSGPIKAILDRVTPVIDPWAYRNVFGKPAEVFIF